jgi:hypothetical protein
MFNRPFARLLVTITLVATSIPTAASADCVTWSCLGLSNPDAASSKKSKKDRSPLAASSKDLPPGWNPNWRGPRYHVFADPIGDLSDVEISPSGYPLIRFVKVPICQWMGSLNEAEEAWKWNNIAWINNIPGCIWVDRPMVVEWTHEQVKNGVVELRIPNEGGRPITVSPNGTPRWRCGSSFSSRLARPRTTRKPRRRRRPLAHHHHPR